MGQNSLTSSMTIENTLPAPFPGVSMQRSTYVAKSCNHVITCIQAEIQQATGGPRDPVDPLPGHFQLSCQFFVSQNQRI